MEEENDKMQPISNEELEQVNGGRSSNCYYWTCPKCGEGMYVCKSKFLKGGSSTYSHKYRDCKYKDKWIAERDA